MLRVGGLIVLPIYWNHFSLIQYCTHSKAINIPNQWKLKKKEYMMFERDEGFQEITSKNGKKKLSKKKKKKKGLSHVCIIHQLTTFPPLSYFQLM